MKVFGSGLLNYKQNRSRSLPLVVITQLLLVITDELTSAIFLNFKTV